MARGAPKTQDMKMRRATKQKTKTQDEVTIGLLIKEAREACGKSNHAPTIITKLMSASFLKRLRLCSSEITSGPKPVVYSGWGDLVSKFLKEQGGGSGEGLGKGQLDLWLDDGQRNLVFRIARSKVNVPSRGEYVLLAPGSITKDEVDEAGEYLKHHGADCIQRGDLLIDLARLM
jgi:hypothetical protein